MSVVEGKVVDKEVSQTPTTCTQTIAPDAQLEEQGETSELSALLHFQVFPKLPCLAALISSTTSSIENLSTQVHEELHFFRKFVEARVEVQTSPALVEAPSITMAPPLDELTLVSHSIAEKANLDDPSAPDDLLDEHAVMKELVSLRKNLTKIVPRYRRYLRKGETGSVPTSVSFVSEPSGASAHTETHLCSHISRTSSVAEQVDAVKGSEVRKGFPPSTDPVHPESSLTTKADRIEEEGSRTSIAILKSHGSRTSFEIDR